jgi:glycosyltransferase involved in cell wall biosynthesis
MRIAVYHNLPSGGAKRALFDYLKATKKHVEYDLYRIDSLKNEEFLDVRPHVNKIYNFHPPQPYFPSWLKWGCILEPLKALSSLNQLQQKIAQQIDSRSYDMVFVHHCSITQSPLLLKYLKTKTIYYAQEPRRKSFEYDFIYNFPIARPGLKAKLNNVLQSYIDSKIKNEDIAAARAATLVLCNSYYSAESIYRAYGLKSTVSYLGVDPEIFRPIKINQNSNYFLSVGALHPAKGHDHTIKMIGKLPQKSRPLLRIVFDRELDGYSEYLQNFAAEHGVELDLNFGISDEELVTQYSNARATICSAHLEPFGYTPIESFFCGTPVIAVKEGGYRETVGDHPAGVLMDRTQPEFRTVFERLIEVEEKIKSDKIRSLCLNYWSLNSAADRLMHILNSASKLS